MKLKLALRQARLKWGRTLVTLTGIALGVTMAVSVLLTGDAIVGGYRQVLERAAGRADLQVRASLGLGMPPLAAADLDSIEGIAAWAPLIISGGWLQHGGEQVSATFYGIDQERELQLREYRLVAGQLPSDDEVTLTDTLASQLKVSVGDQVQVLTTEGRKQLEVVGLVDASGTARGAAGGYALTTLQTADGLFSRQGKLDAIDLQLAPNAQAEQVKAALADLVGEAGRVGTPLEKSNDLHRLLNGGLFVMNLAGSVALVAGLFIIYTNVSISVAERRQELAILRALGLYRREALGMLLGEMALVGLVGGLIGLALGYGLAETLVQQMAAQFLKSYGISTVQVALSVEILLLSLGMALGSSVITSWLPARRVVTISPVEAMGTDPGQAQASRRLWPWGLLLLLSCSVVFWVTWPHEGMLPEPVLNLWALALALGLIGLVLLLPSFVTGLGRLVLQPLFSRLFGVTGRLAADGFSGHPARSAATIATLVVTLTVMVAMGGMKASQMGSFDRWFEKTVGWDALVSSSYVGIGAAVELSDGLEAELAELPGVALVSPQKFTSIALADGQQAFLQVFDHQRLARYSEVPLDEGDWPSVRAAMAEGGAALISPAVARRLDLQLGDRLTLPAMEGQADFEVVGIMTDVTPYGGTVQIDRADYLAGWADPTVTAYALVLEPGTTAEAIREAITDRWSHLQVQLNREFWAEIHDQLDAFYQLMDGLIAISILVSGLAIANTLYASLLERRREFGTLRALGAKRGEVVRLVSLEALATGLVGAPLGLGAGLGLGWLMVASNEAIQGSSMQWQFVPEPIGLALAVALLFGPLVGLLPARRAAQLEVVDALRYE